MADGQNAYLHSNHFTAIYLAIRHSSCKSVNIQAVMSSVGEGSRGGMNEGLQTDFTDCLTLQTPQTYHRVYNKSM